MPRFALACLTAGVAWIVVETLGGLAFLAGGLRLWRYEILPVAWAITSPVVWTLAALLIVPLCRLFDLSVTFRLPRSRWLAARLAFLMIVGPVIEIVLNEFCFERAVGRPLYVYTFLETFGGHGSLLSPLYYATLIVHAPIADRLLPPPVFTRVDAAAPAEAVG